MLKPDQERVVIGCQRAAHGKPQQPNERPRLLVTAVLGKPGDDVADRGMERVRFADAFDKVSGVVGMVSTRFAFCSAST